MTRWALTGSAILLCIDLGACTVKSDPPAPVVTRPSAAQIPCDATRVLKSVCQQCHTAPPRNSAPFPLVTYDDTQVVASGKPIWRYMLTALQNGLMPLPPVQIALADRDALIRWLNAGAPPRVTTNDCSEQDAGSDAAGDSPDSPAADADDEDASGDAGTLDALDALEGDAPPRSSDNETESDAGIASLDACTLDDGSTPCE